LVEKQKERMGRLVEIVLAVAQIARSISEQLVRLATGDEWRWVSRIAQRNC